MIDLNSNKLSYALVLVINLLLVEQFTCTNTTAVDLEATRNETLNNEIADSVLDKYKVSKDLKYYLNAFDNLQNKSTDSLSSQGRAKQGNLNNRNESTINNSTTTTSPSVILNNSTNLDNSTSSDRATFVSSSNQTDLNSINKTSSTTSGQPSRFTTERRDDQTNQTSSKEIELHLFKSMCSLTGNQVQACERYECNKNTCYCNDAFDLTLNLKSNWPIKYMCLNKVNYNEDCLVDDQCGKHQVCLNKRNFRNYLNHDLDYSILNERIETLIKTTNSTSDLNRQIFSQQMSVLYNQTKLTEFRGKCRCKSGYFYNYYLSYSNKNKHFNKQFNSFLIESNSSNINDLFAKQRNLFMGHCLKVRKLDEVCELNSECQMNDPSSICRRSKCICKTGYQVEIRNQSEQLNQTSSVLLNKLTSPSANATTRLICEPILNLNLELSHHHANRLVEKQHFKNDSTANYQQLNRNNVQMIKNLLNKNCTDELIICEGRHNCIKKSKRLHVQENFASLVWTVLCMLSIMLVLCMLLVKNKQDDSLELNHNYNNYFLRNSSVNNLNHQTTSFLGNMFNRSHLNAASATELQNINERNLICKYYLV